ncbi:MAG TPA: hypothetical protein VN800_01470 [Candidatus Acidoferrales bacterium]|nr:hypothetical protein [Candidatus Acidoferrales bacterium]
MQQFAFFVRFYLREFRSHAPTMLASRTGQGLAEYALILALIAIIAIAALIFLGGKISGILRTVGSSI